MKIRTTPALSYDDVLLAPKLGILNSRSDADLSTSLSANIGIDIPIIASPMSSVTDATIAVMLAELGGAAFLPRQCSIEHQVKTFASATTQDYYLMRTRIGAAVGVTDFDRFHALLAAGCRLFCLDIAHGHTLKAANFLSRIEPVASDIEMIVGSIATAEAVEWYGDRFQIHGFRVGIGSGAACTTRRETGFGVPQLTAIIESVEAARDIPVIADGGIKNSGDIVKALAAGASSVMLGRLLAGAEEAPQPGLYYGMASYRAQQDISRETYHIEGEEGEVSIEGSLTEILNNLLAGIRSGISYGGGRNIDELQTNAEFIPVGHGTHLESSVRI